METIRARCPGCQKLYGVDPKDVKDRHPEFLCRKCGQKFWFEFPPVGNEEEVPTFTKSDSAASAPKPGTATKQCPKCKSDNPTSSSSCLYCGIIFEKFGKKRDSGVATLEPNTQVLKASWDNLLANYEKMELHEKFVSDCLAAKQLTYASAQYRKMLEANPNDSTALKMRDKIIGLATVTFIPPKRAEKPPERMNFLFLFAFIALAAGVFGTFVGKFKWLQPVGFSVFLIVAAFIGYRIYTRQNSD